MPSHKSKKKKIKTNLQMVTKRPDWMNDCVGTHIDNVTLKNAKKKISQITNAKKSNSFMEVDKQTHTSEAAELVV